MVEKGNKPVYSPGSKISVSVYIYNIYIFITQMHFAGSLVRYLVFLLDSKAGSV